MSNLKAGLKLLADVRLYLWIFWIYLVVVWILTLVNMHDSIQYVYAALILMFLVVLYFAEGMEIAVAGLLDKEVAQLRDATDARRAAPTLEDIKLRDPEWFFAQRQVFVVTIVSAMSLMTSYERIWLPFVGWVDKEGMISIGSWSLTIPKLPFWFSLLFTSLTILWWCQVFPKRLAIRNSKIFLHDSSILWAPIKAMGKLNLPGPADALVWIAKERTRYQRPANLTPGRATYYVTAAKLYGYSRERVSIEIRISEDGAARVTQRTLLLLLHGKRTSAAGGTSSDSAFTQVPEIDLIAFHTLQVPEKLEELEDSLRHLFRYAELPKGETRFSANLREGLSLSRELSPKKPNGNDKSVKWELIWGVPYPEALGPDQLAVFLYESRVEFGPGAYKRTDYFTGSIEAPVRHFSFLVRGPDGGKLWITKCEAKVQPAAPFDNESQRVMEIIRDKYESRLELPYPLPGTMYDIHWHGTANIHAPGNQQMIETGDATLTEPSSEDEDSG